MESVSKKSINIATYARKYGTVVAFIVICIFFGSTSPVFFTGSNIVTILRQISMLSILGIGLTVVMITGGIDLSIGYGTSFLGIFCAALIVNFHMNMWTAAFLTIVCGLLIGMLNGFLVSYVGIPNFICTLSTGFLVAGINQAYTKGHPISGLPDSFGIFGNAMIMGIPSLIIVMAIWLVIVAFILQFTRFGRHTYAIGGNEEASTMSGVNTKLTTMFCYVISGIGMAICALALTSRMGSAHAQAGDNYTLNAIACVYLGATAFKDGEPNLSGSVLGALILGVLTNGLTLLNVEYYYQDISQGIIILLAVTITSLQRIRKK